MNNGWVKLHRKFLDWEWFSDINTCHIFLFCLMKANHSTKKWQGVDIHPGQFISSQTHISEQTGLTVMQVRTCLNKLKSTGELTVKTTNKYSMFSITNWYSYQDDNRQDNSQVTIKQQADNNQVTTNKNDKKEKNEENNITSPSPKADPVPFTKIVELYHEKLPELSKVEKLTTTRKGYIRQRWIEDLPDIEHWTNYFDYVRQSDFLMGKTQPNGDRRPFRCSLEWLTKPANFAKVSEEAYHG